MIIKMLFCTECKDLFTLIGIERRCACYAVGGRLTIKNNAIYDGESALPIELNGDVLVLMKIMQPELNRQLLTTINIVGKNDKNYKNTDKVTTKKSLLSVDFG